MSKEDFSLDVELVGARDAFLTLDKLQKRADELGKTVMEVKRESLRELRKITFATRSFISGARNIFAAFGGALDPFQTALVTTAITAIETVTEVAAAVATTGVGIPWAAVMSSALLGLNLVTLPAIFQGVQEAREGVSRATSFLEGLSFFGSALSQFG